MPKFSIIVPVYNVAPYLRECLGSVSAQTFDDWECLCVDDGSTDESGAILDEYVAKDKRFRVIHQPNHGVSSARNRALEQVKGDYVGYLDSDDAYHPALLRDICECLSVVAADYIRIPLQRINRHREQWGDDVEPVAKFVNLTNTILTLQAVTIGGICCFVKRTQLHDIQFNQIPNGEDALYAIDCFKRAHRPIQLCAPRYRYLIREGSATHSATLNMLRAHLTYNVLLKDALRTWDTDARGRRALQGWVIASLSKHSLALLKQLPLPDQAVGWQDVFATLSVFAADTVFFSRSIRIICAISATLKSPWAVKVMLQWPYAVWLTIRRWGQKGRRIQ